MKNTWRFGEAEFNYIREVLDSGFGSGTSGGMNNRFEVAFAEKVGAKWAVTFNSGTSTLHAALHALGVGYGDEVIMPALTVISNLSVTLAQNAIPVFADINENTFNIDPDDIERKITPRTKAIQVVPIYGLPCQYDRISEIAKKHDLPIINDAAQAFGAKYKGRSITETCSITSYSLENSKHITTGDGGIIVTDSEEYAARMRKFGSLGYAAMTSGDGRIRLNRKVFQDPNYKRHDDLGLNYRMPEVAAAVGLAQTERMDFFLKTRLDTANLYDEVVKDVAYLTPQLVPDDCESSYWCYSLRYLHDEISWQDFSDKYVEFGGDGVYAAWALTYHETLISSGAWKRHCPPLYQDLEYENGLCPIAERVQPTIMQLVNNYGSLEEAQPKVEALHKTIQYFG